MNNDIRTEIISYSDGSKNFQGFLAVPETDQKAPGVLIAHAWKGQDEFARKKAIALAELGYVAMAADVYGEGATAETDEEAIALMLPLFLDRELLRKRICKGFDTLRNSPFVDNQKMGVIGFCFGGLTAIELLKSGASLCGTVSFHGVLGSQIGEHKAHLAPLAHELKGKLLVLHGYNDPLVSPHDIETLQKEMSEAKVDWEMDIYGHTSHAFTNPEAHDHSKGLIYNATADRRSWQSMRNFFEEVFA